MMCLRTSHSVGALLLLLAAHGAPSAGSRSPASGTLARPRLEGSASGRPREPQAEFGRRQATSGAHLLKLGASDGVADDYFGYVVAVSSDGARVVVGAHADDAYSGSVHVFNGTSGERLLKLVASDGAEGDYFGMAVAVSSDGARVVVGAYYDDDQGDGSGSVHVFDGTAGERLLKLVASDGAAYDYFGYVVAVSSDGARVVVGADGDDDNLAPCTCSTVPRARGCSSLWRVMGPQTTVSESRWPRAPTGPAWWWGPTVTTTRAAGLAPCTCSMVPRARGCSSLWRVMGPQTTVSESRWPRAPTGPAWWWGPTVTTTRAAGLAPCTCSMVPRARGCSSLWRVMGPQTTVSESRWPRAPTGPAWWWGPSVTTTRATLLAPCTSSTVPPARGCSSLWRVMGQKATFSEWRWP
ncbi:unnamed protein product [Prorocentrum cordatum]|uniref:Subtilisin n=1 Tax=Prorocentrum cordatum TaxID=2364126 RepID=A0ABN9VXE8_9DINO|nr:unnamed protein product [Polarella glacialis]